MTYEDAETELRLVMKDAAKWPETLQPVLYKAVADLLNAIDAKALA